MQGIDTFKVLCHVNSLNELAAIVVGDSGATLTLISQEFLQSLTATKPKPWTGHKLKLLQLMGLAGCSEYVKLDLYFWSQLGPICLKGIEAYVVKDMKANMLIGKDTQLAWQLHTIWEEGKSHWKVGNLLHHIPAILGSTPKETFTASWTSAAALLDKPATMPSPHATWLCSCWNTIAKQQLMILLESIACITAVSRGAPAKGAMYLESMYTCTYKYIVTHVTNCENFQYLKGGQNLRLQISNHYFLNSNDCFF